jgi:RND family efflux transporter MFP subunit
MTDVTPVSRPHGYTWKIIAPAAVVLTAALIVTYLVLSSTSVKRTPPKQEARLVEVTTVSPETTRITVEAWGTVQAARQVKLQSQVAGEVKRTGDGFEPGAHVSKNELLLQIDPADYQLAVRQRRADLTKAQADLALEEGRRAVAEQEFELLAKETGATEDERRLMLREPQRETARAAVASAEAALSEARLNLARTTVKAPFNALVLDRQVNTGTRVSNGAELATLVDTDTFWVELAVPAASLRWLELPADGQPGSKVLLYQEQVWGKERYREGRVIRVRGDLDEKGRMARLLVAVDDPLSLHDPQQPPMLLGAFVRAEIAGRELPDVLALKRGWLRDDDTLWLMNQENKLVIRRLQPLYSSSDNVYVQDGIEPGERIVTSELAVPVDGMPLRTAEEPKKAKP